MDGVVCLMTGHSSQDGISCKSRLKFFSSYWSVLVSFDPSNVSQKFEDFHINVVFNITFKSASGKSVTYNIL